MSNEQIRIEIAKLMGWRFEKSEEELTIFNPAGKEVAWMIVFKGQPWGDFLSFKRNIPNYPESLDACAILEATIRDDNSLNGMVAYCNTLMQVCGSHRACVMATPLQRCEAFLKLHGKWVAE